MQGREERSPRRTDDAEQVSRAALLDRLRTLSWPQPEPGAARSAFERFSERLDENAASDGDS
jgi:hypothetical protein